MIELVDRVAGELEFLPNPRMFFGAAVLSLYLDAPGVDPLDVRPSEDVDVVVDVAVAAHGSAELLEAALRAHGFAHDTRPHRRNIHARTTTPEALDEMLASLAALP